MSLNNIDIPEIIFNEDAARYLLSSTNSPPCLIFLEGQYLFYWFENGRANFKLVSSTSVRAAFSQEPIDSGWLPKNIIRCGLSVHGSWAIKFIPPQKFELTIDNKSILVPLPSLIFLGIGTDYNIWAIKETEFSANAKIFHAPLPNIDYDGKICFGSNIMPDATPTGIEQAWHLFVESSFTSHLIQGKSKEFRDDIREKLMQKFDVYPLADLVQYQAVTITSEIEELLGIKYAAS